MLVAVESIAIFFHLWYVLSLACNRDIVPSNGRNLLKWLEYSVTATMGAIAVANSGVTQLKEGVTLAVVVLGVMQ